MLLRIDDTDRTREVEGAVEEIVADLDWLGIVLNEGPVRRAAASNVTARRRARWGRRTRRARSGSDGRRCSVPTAAPPTTWRASSTTTISRSRTSFAAPTTARTPSSSGELSRALGFEPPEYVHHGLLLGSDGKKFSKRTGAPTIASLRRRASRPRRYVRISRSWVSPRTTSIWTRSGFRGSRSTRSRRSRTRH